MPGKIDLVRAVSKRLFIAIFVLVIVFFTTLVVTISATNLPSSTVLLVFIVGQAGGYVGLQRRIKKLNTEDLELLSTSWIYTILSPLVGGILAVVLYMIFASELITGQLFPAFEPDSGTAEIHNIKLLFAYHCVSYIDYAKLMVWSFIAGFTEKLVVNVIGTFTTKELEKE
jgi:hypothetical protein